MAMNSPLLIGFVFLRKPRVFVEEMWYKHFFTLLYELILNQVKTQRLKVTLVLASLYVRWDIKLFPLFWTGQIKFDSVYFKVCCDQVLQTILMLCSMALLRCCSRLANLVSKPIRSICFTAAKIRIQPYTTHKPFLLRFLLFPHMSRWYFEEKTIFDEMKSWCYSNHTKCEIECRSMCLFIGFILHKRQLYVKIFHFLLIVFLSGHQTHFKTDDTRLPWSKIPDHLRISEALKAFCIFNASLLK